MEERAASDGAETQEPAMEGGWWKKRCPVILTPGHPLSPQPTSIID